MPIEPQAKKTLAGFCAFGPDLADYATVDCMANPPGAPPMPIGQMLATMGAMKNGPFPGWKSKMLEDGTYPRKNADGTYSVLTQQLPGPMKADFPELGAHAPAFASPENQGWSAHACRRMASRRAVSVRRAQQGAQGDEDGGLGQPRRSGHLYAQRRPEKGQATQRVMRGSVA